MAYAISLHVLAAIIWVGGMFFAYVALRPVADNLLEPAIRQKLWAQVFRYFFPWVWIAILALLGSGFWMVVAGFGGMAKIGTYVHLMMGLGIFMMMLFMHMYFGPFRRLQRAVASDDTQDGAGRLKQIRILFAINLVLGLVVVVFGAGGRFF